MPTYIGYGVGEAKAPLKLMHFAVRELRANDVEIDIHYSGICHTDLHEVDNDWKASIYPMIPGHEIAGKVSRVGSEVTGLRVGDNVGVGCMIWSCRQCKHCVAQEENYCKDVVLTYSGKMPDGEITYGGYANKMTAPSEFVVKIPVHMDLRFAAPLLCAGITCWSPMIRWGMNKPGSHIGVIGCGGLGHLAIQFAAKFGNRCTVISTSANKEQFARELGATDFCVSTDPESIKKYQGTLTHIIDTVSAPKPIELYLSLLDVNGVLCTVGLPEDGVKLDVIPAQLVWRRLTLCGSVVGSVKEMGEMMTFCAEKDIKPMIETIPATYINEAFSRIRKNDVKFRFVIDIKGTMPIHI